MARMKFFLIWLSVFLAFYLFVDFMAYQYVVASYKNIKSYQILEDSPSVSISESKATGVNGYINGTVTNTTGKRIEKTNIKIDFYSRRGVLLGTNYVKLEYFNTNETREFNTTFRFRGVHDFKVSFTDEDVDAQIEEQAKELQAQTDKWLPFAGLLTVLCFLP